jgi:hypothetical protein
MTKTELAWKSTWKNQINQENKRESTVPMNQEVQQLQ